MNRRTFIHASAAATIGAAAGCIESEESDRESGGSDGNGGQGGSDESQPVELLEHEWYMEGQYSSGVRGRVENISGEELSYVTLTVFFLDSEDVQIGEGLDSTTDLAAGRVWEFDALYLDDDPQRVDSYEIKTEVTNI